MSKSNFDMNTIRAVLQKSDGHCWYCGCDLTIESRFAEVDQNTYVIEHLVPKFLGGGNEMSNLVPACFSCNSSKRTGTVEQFRYLRTRQKHGMPSFNDEQVTYLSANGISLPTMEPHVFYFETKGLKP